MYSCYLFLISSAFFRSKPFLSFIVPIFAWNVPLVSNFLEELSSVSHFFVCLFVCFPLFLCIDHWGRLLLFFETLHLNGPIFPFLLCLSLFFFPQFIRPSQTAILPLCISFSWGWSWSLPPVQCNEPPSIVHQALSLSDLILWIYFSLPLYNHKGYDLGHMSSGFPYFLQFQSEFGNKEFMIWVTVSSWSCFCWLYGASPSLAVNNIISLISVLSIWWCPCVQSSLVLFETWASHKRDIL